ncbi:MAG: DUF367 domain-containing protein [Lentisphaerae bacterium]|jgi:pre-rRNA-processing protein TSR3|nr:DUF367 domain-containing protein [Lentisphaerota bacterium]MBT5612599.1 DUF367 domain-containing protein [Lentisphaerota bacterium]MBT7059258.1 DUF367 domain-containing protein [Lentisphaerota bacterium]MBT7845811.1 DUF367 domain-containing protein [Lentisphaerota bacterium]
MPNNGQHNPVVHAPTVVIRHRREKGHKCSILPLRGRADFVFHVHPVRQPLDLTDYVRLGVRGTLLSDDDANRGLLVLDASWHRVQVLERAHGDVPVRSLPPWRTAYPRVSKIRQDPPTGLATIEAVFAAMVILGRDPTGILDDYVWRDRFLALNRDYLA